jgi:hypothetical protein
MPLQRRDAGHKSRRTLAPNRIPQASQPNEAVCDKWTANAKATSWMAHGVPQVRSDRGSRVPQHNQSIHDLQRTSRTLHEIHYLSLMTRIRLRHYPRLELHSR